MIPKIDLFETGLPFFAGDRLELAFDGQYIRCQGFAWSLEKLLLEIWNEEQQIWDIEADGILVVISTIERPPVATSPDQENPKDGNGGDDDETKD